MIITNGRYRIVYKWMPSISAYMIDIQQKAPGYMVSRDDHSINADGYLSCVTEFRSNEREAEAAFLEAFDRIDRYTKEART